MSSEPITSRRRGSSSAPHGCMIPFGLVFMVAGGAILWFLTFRPVLRVLDAQTWPEVPCTVVESHVEESSDSDGSTYKAVVTFNYLYEGREFTSSRWDFTDFSSSGYEGKAEVVARYPAGSRAVAYVNPSNPSEAVLVRNFSLRYLLGLFGLMFFLPGLFLVIWGVGSRAKGKAADRELVTDPASPFGVTNPQGDVDGPVELKPQATPLGKLIGLIFASLIWNGIVWTIILISFRDQGRPEGCLIAFLAVFALIGLLLIYGTFRQFLVLFNPRPKLTLSPGSLPLGGTVYLQWRLSGGTGGVRRLRVTLEGREEAQYRRGTNTYTDREVFALIPLVDTTNEYQMATGSTSFVLPADTIPSFRAEHNRIVWTIKAQLEIANWPDSEEEFEVLVRPGR
jgi:Protein of unknown function (DUF3592)